MRSNSSAREMSVLTALIEQEKGLMKFRYSDLKRATNNFSLERTVGAGVFGRVYRGVLDHQELAIQRVLIESEQPRKECITSIITTSKLRHRNLVQAISWCSKLRHRNLVQAIGWCHEQGDFLFVYEFIPNRDLSYHLHNRRENVLPWEIRFRIALGLASALHYLHEEYVMCVVHRNVHPGNVMLDEDFNAKLGGFGLALRLDHGATSTVDTVTGRNACLAPEYVLQGKVGEKCDVFGFGAVALEIACARKPYAISNESGQEFLVEWVRNLYREGLILEAADKRLLSCFDHNQMKTLLVVGLWCMQTDPELRPSMLQVINVLKGEAPLPKVPTSQVPSVVSNISSGREEEEAEFSIPYFSDYESLILYIEGDEAEAPAYEVPTDTNEIEDDDAKLPLPQVAAYEVRAEISEVAQDVATIDAEIEKAKAPKEFPYSDLEHATENFSEARRVGEGGFGAVYKGLLNGEEVAIKRVWSGLEHGKKQYIAEIKSICDLRHRNLVRFVGWCHERRDFLLVYEFLPNGDLKSHLHSEEQKKLLPWGRRFKIALGLASALHYLHEQSARCVCHRDVKSSNVMLDADFNARLGDFGLALQLDHSDTGKLTTPAGTLGYWAPEIFNYKARKESDVYSFGVVALEIACGRKPIGDDDEEPGSKMHLVEWVRRLYGKGFILEAADQRLDMIFEEQQMKSLLIVGLWCAQQDYRLRPSMRQVIGVLKGEVPLPKLDLSAYKGQKWVRLWPLSRRKALKGQSYMK